MAIATTSTGTSTGTTTASTASNAGMMDTLNSIMSAADKFDKASSFTDIYSSTKDLLSAIKGGMTSPLDSTGTAANSSSNDALTAAVTADSNNNAVNNASSATATAAAASSAADSANANNSATTSATDTGSSSSGGSTAGSSAGGMFSSVSIICTELYSQHRLTKALWVKNLREFDNLPDYIKVSYYRWAKPVVRHLRRSPNDLVSNFFCLLFNAYAKKSFTARWTVRIITGISCFTSISCTKVFINAIFNKLEFFGEI